MELPDAPFPLDTPVPATYEAALRSMADSGVLGSQRWQEQQWRANREGAHPVILEFERVFIKRMRALRVPMFAHNMVRTHEQQNKLLADGVSRASGGNSPHNFGLAVDIVHSVRAWDLKPREWALIGHIGKELAKSKGWRLTWGGDWNFYDPAHWEFTDWRGVNRGFPFMENDK